MSGVGVGRRLAALAVAWVVCGIALAGPARAQGQDDLARLSAEVSRLHGQGKYAQAVPIAERYVELARQQHGEEHPAFATAVAWLAIVHRDQGRFAEAEPLFKRSLAIFEKALGPQHPSVGTALNNLASLYQGRGRLAEAEPLLKRGLAIRQKALGPDHPAAGQSLSSLAGLYRAQGRYAEAEPLYKRSLAISENALGPEHPEVGTSLYNLASLYQSRGRLDEAEPLYKRGLAVREKALGPDHPAVGQSLSSLAGLYRDQGRYAEAEPLYKRSLAIWEKALGPEHPDVGASLNNLASLYQGRGRLAEAEPLYKRGLAIREKALGPDHPAVGQSLSSLAGLYRAQGRYAEAEPLYKRSLAISEKTLGPNHLNVTAPLNGVAELHRAQGRYAEAEPLYRRSLAISEKALGPDHPTVAAPVNSLAELYRAQGRYAEAEPLSRRSLAISEKALGPDHPTVATALNNMADLHQAQGHYAEAEPLYRRSLAISEKALGPDHPTVATLLNNLALLYRARGRYTDSEPLLKRSLAISEKALAPNHPSIAAPLNNLASLYSAQGRYAEAEPFFKRSLAIAEKALGPDHPNVGQALNSLAELYRAQGRYAEAEPLYRRSLAISEKALGPDHPTVATALNNLAGLYRAQGRYAEAEPPLRRSLSIREKALGPDHPTVATSLNGLAQLYEAQRRSAEAEPLFKRSLAIREKALGPDHPAVGQSLSNVAGIAYVQSDWKRAADYWRRSTTVIKRRAESGLSGAVEGSSKGEAQRLSWQFSGLVKVTHRLAAPSPTAALAAEMFETAQWAQTSEAAVSLAQMAARSSKGSVELAGLARERQDLVREWQVKDELLTAAKSTEPAERKPEAEKALASRLAAIDTRLSEINRRLAQDFPDYAAMASPAPVPVTEVQAWLRPDEALVLFLDTDARFKPLPEESFIWVVTRNDVRWARSELGTSGLAREVTALRCGLDAAAWDSKGAERCAYVLGIPAAKGAPTPLPFDHARAHKLYSALFGQVQDVIKDKHLLIVPSGPLTQLPFQVLVSSLPEGFSSDEHKREIAVLGAEVKDLSDGERKQLQLASGGVRVGRVKPQSAAEAAGIRTGDIIQTLDAQWAGGVKQTIDAIRSRAPRSSLRLGLLRNGEKLEVSVVLGAMMMREWRPSDLDRDGARAIRWLAHEHAVTVLPAVSSLKALRRVARPSAAQRSMVGFGNPLLDGPDASSANRARLARTRQRCPETLGRWKVTVTGHHRPSVARVATRGGLADLSHLKGQIPLPETTDELCDVAHDIKADVARDIHLGARATEREVKRLSTTGELAKYRLVHFATHGALAGELDGAHEPGLILTPPATATEDDDGYLTASEIAALKLDADWVVLSACNTAAGGAPNAEALSGLGRAFIYAGARSLLVSHWAVYSDATVKLITGAVDEMARDARVGRAEGMRRSMLALIDKGSEEEAHPAFWAPFVVVGEGAAVR
jgi:tetratricopeptide (TPR) repeat protein/CHAT domain-containing protein